MLKREMTQLEKFIINILSRRAWVLYPPKALILEKAKKIVMNGKRKLCFYKCDICKQDTFKLTEVEVHHIEARIDPVKGWEGIEVWVARTFCSIKLLQVVCKLCHHNLSATQNETRREVKKGKGKKDDKNSRPKQTRRDIQRSKKRAKRGNGVAH